MHQCLTHLVLLLPFAWNQVSASLNLDFEASPDPYYPDDSFLTSTETTGWSERDGDWSTDPEPDSELTAALNPELNPDLLVDTSSNQGCQSDADQLQMTTGRRLRRQDFCPNTLFQTSPSSQDATNKKFLESLPTFTMYTYKEPDPKFCPEELFGRFIYPVCGSSEEVLFADGINIDPCNPYTPRVGCTDPTENVWCCKWVDWLPGVPIIEADLWTPEICKGYSCVRAFGHFHRKS